MLQKALERMTDVAYCPRCQAVCIAVRRVLLHTSAAHIPPRVLGAGCRGSGYRGPRCRGPGVGARGVTAVSSDLQDQDEMGQCPRCFYVFCAGCFLAWHPTEWVLLWGGLSRGVAELCLEDTSWPGSRVSGCSWGALTWGIVSFVVVFHFCA